MSINSIDTEEVIIESPDDGDSNESKEQASQELEHPIKRIEPVGSKRFETSSSIILENVPRKLKDRWWYKGIAMVVSVCFFPFVACFLSCDIIFGMFIQEEVCKNVLGIDSCKSCFDNNLCKKIQYKYIDDVIDPAIQGCKDSVNCFKWKCFVCKNKEMPKIMGEVLIYIILQQFVEIDYFYKVHDLQKKNTKLMEFYGYFSYQKHMTNRKVYLIFRNVRVRERVFSKLSDINLFFSNLPRKLYSFNFYHHKVPFTMKKKEDEFFQKIDKMENLRSLSFPRIKYENHGYYGINLEKIVPILKRMKDCGFVFFPSKEGIGLIEKLKNARTIKLKIIRTCFENEIFAPKDNIIYPKLQELSIESNAFSFIEPILCDVLKNVPTLKKLTMTFCYRFDNNEVHIHPKKFNKSIISHGSRLKFVKFENYSYLQDTFNDFLEKDNLETFYDLKLVITPGGNEKSIKQSLEYLKNFKKIRESLNTEAHKIRISIRKRNN